MARKNEDTFLVRLWSTKHGKENGDTFRGCGLRPKRKVKSKAGVVSGVVTETLKRGNTSETLSFSVTSVSLRCIAGDAEKEPRDTRAELARAMVKRTSA